MIHITAALALLRNSSEVVIVQSFLPFLAHFLHIGTAELGSLGEGVRTAWTAVPRPPRI